MEIARTECLELEGKVVHRCSLYHDGPYGPEILRKTSDEAELLKDFSTSA